MAYSDARGLKLVRQLWALARYKVEHRHTFADVKYRSFERIRAMLEEELGSLEGKTLLEVGCGQWQTNVKLLSALGARLVGVDPELPPSSLLEYGSFARDVGPQRAVKTALNELLLRRSFDRRLQELSGLSFARSKPRLQRRGAERLDLDDASVDAAFSDDVFEHLPDMPAVVAEMARVLKPGAPAVIIIHPFAAFSGGHHPATMRHGDAPLDEGGVPPWDHLRRRERPSGVYLNELRASDYREALESHFDLVSWEELGPEGEDYLTDEIVDELGDFNREELLVGKIIAHVRR